MVRIFLLLIALFLYFPNAKSHEVYGSNNNFISTDSLQISILTIDSSDDLKTQFGHLCIRVKDSENHSDDTYHFGGYLQNQNLFPLRFILGRIYAHDYVTTYNEFLDNYKGRSFYETELLLTEEEKAHILNLIHSFSTTNFTAYRYDLLSENCSTKIYSILKLGVDGTFEFNIPDTLRTSRSIINQYCDNSPWVRLGINVLMGYGYDRPLMPEEQNFVPITLFENMQHVFVRNNNGTHHLTSKITYFENENVNKRVSTVLHPMTMLIIILFISIFTIIIEVKKRKICITLDCFLYSLLGILGIITTSVFLFSYMSYHEENILILILNPIHLLYLPFMLWLTIKKRKDYYHVINLFLFSLFLILFKATPQVFPVELIPVALIFILRSGIHILFRFFPNYLPSNR